MKSQTDKDEKFDAEHCQGDAGTNEQGKKEASNAMSEQRVRTKAILASPNLDSSPRQACVIEQKQALAWRG